MSFVDREAMVFGGLQHLVHLCTRRTTKSTISPNVIVLDRFDGVMMPIANSCFSGIPVAASRRVLILLFSLISYRSYARRLDSGNLRHIPFKSPSRLLVQNREGSI